MATQAGGGWVSGRIFPVTDETLFPWHLLSSYSEIGLYIQSRESSQPGTHREQGRMHPPRQVPGGTRKGTERPWAKCAVMKQRTQARTGEEWGKKPWAQNPQDLARLQDG